MKKGKETTRLKDNDMSFKLSERIESKIEKQKRAMKARD